MSSQTPLMNRYDVIIIGGGVAGLSAGIYTARDGFSTLILEGDYMSNTVIPGGALLLTPEIENYPGFMQGSGEELITLMRTQAQTFGADIKTGFVEKIHFNDSPCEWHTVITSDGDEYASKSIILSTGASSRLLNVGEENLIGQGVSTCATCDGFFFKDKHVIVVGGGDTAVEDALYLLRYTPHVTMIVRKNTFRSTGPDARKALALAEDETNKFTVIWDTEVSKVTSNEMNELQLDLHNLQTGETSHATAEGLFVAIGRDPLTDFLRDSPIQLDSEGFITRGEGTNAVRGDTYGVFAAGDAVDKVFRQAITSAGRGVEAALEVREYLLHSAH
jgi:thioredoxin reductase (NADPH)